ncbi:hypothetical protein BLSTO_03411 [Blastocystis sp. subtype 1]
MDKSFESIIHDRRSIRSFESTPIPDEVLHRITEDINLCPTAGNIQSYHVYIVRNPKLIEQITIASGQGWIQQAPCVFVFCCDFKDHYYGKRGAELYSLQDATIAQTYAILACNKEGLKSCWVGSFVESEVSSILNIPSHLRPIGLLPCGYSEAAPRHERSRRDVEETFTYCCGVS